MKFFKSLPVKFTSSKVILLGVFFFFTCQNAKAWGFWAHKRINRMACFSLAPELFGFYKKQIDYLTEHAVDPDRRRHSDKAEAPRHYIDIDHYGDHAIDSLPHFWKDAVEKYSEDTLQSYGIVPWYIPKVYYRLLAAFKERDEKKILYYSANLGHYIGDACVPLHCTENYNGQLTNQYGIHGFWESRLPELYGDEYDYFCGRAEYIEKIQEYCWDIIKGSSAALDSVLDFERELNSQFSSDQKYSYDSRGAVTMKVYSEEYSQKFHMMLDGQVERRMRKAIISVASFWYTAWINAGSPDLSGMKVNEEEFIPEEIVNQDSLKINSRICD